MLDRGKQLLALAVGVLLLGIVVFFRQPIAGAVVVLAEWVEGLGSWAPVAFTAALTVAVPLCLPATPFLLASGVLFGALAGMVWAGLGTVLGGALAFLLGRKVVRATVERRLAGEPGFEAMNRALRAEGARSIALIRLSPALPAWLINYALGVSRARWRDYWWSSVAVLPSVALFTLTGAGLADLAMLQRAASPNRGPAYYALLGAGIVATLVASLLLGRRARRILAEMEE